MTGSTTAVDTPAVAKKPPAPGSAGPSAPAGTGVCRELTGIAEDSPDIAGDRDQENRRRGWGPCHGAVDADVQGPRAGRQLAVAVTLGTGVVVVWRTRHPLTRGNRPARELAAEPADPVDDDHVADAGVPQGAGHADGREPAPDDHHDYVAGQRVGPESLRRHPEPAAPG